MFYFGWEKYGSGGKRGAATAGIGSVGVVERKPSVIQPIFPVDFHTKQIYGMGFLHQHLDAIDFEDLVVFFFLIESQDIRKPGTSASLNADPRSRVGQRWIVPLLSFSVPAPLLPSER